MRTSAGASTPCRTWLPRTSRPRAQELPRDVLDVGAVVALRHQGAEPRHLLLPQDVERAHLALEAREEAADVRDADAVRGAGGGPGHMARRSAKARMEQDFRLI